MAAKAQKQTIHGQPSYHLHASKVDGYVTERGGHLAPVTFTLARGKKVQPFMVAPWAEETVPKGTPDLLKVLRGDFFCLPFGNNENEAYKGEKHPYHGETASSKWTLVAQQTADGERALHMRMTTKIRPGQVDKTLRVVDGHAAVYSRHTVSGMSGPSCVGHHATLQFPDYDGAGVITTSRFVHGQVYPGAFEDPTAGGYSILKPGAVFKNLNKVPMLDGSTTDLSRYPARRGYEDLAFLITDPSLKLGWTAVTYPKEGYVWFGLKDPSTLTGTLMWHSNGGRHYAPWNGRTTNVLGLEEITSHFHDGIKVSSGKNSLTERGYTTCLKFSKTKPTTINYIMAMAAVPKTFDKVKAITITKTGVKLKAASGDEVDVPLDTAWLYGG